jgi:hypothetical protein
MKNVLEKQWNRLPMHFCRFSFEQLWKRFLIDKFPGALNWCDGFKVFIESYERVFGIFYID